MYNHLNMIYVETSGKRLKYADIVRMMFSSGYNRLHIGCSKSVKAERIKVFHWSGKCLLYFCICLNGNILSSDYTS